MGLSAEDRIFKSDLSCVSRTVPCPRGCLGYLMEVGVSGPIDNMLKCYCNCCGLVFEVDIVQRTAGATFYVGEDVDWNWIWKEDKWQYCEATE